MSAVQQPVTRTLKDGHTVQASLVHDGPTGTAHILDGEVLATVEVAQRWIAGRQAADPGQPLRGHIVTGRLQGAGAEGTPAASAPDPHESEAVLHAYGVACPTRDETRARVAVLDRMGAFSPGERNVLIAAGHLGEPHG